MASWYKARQKILDNMTTSPSAISECEDLLKIIDKADDWGLKPNHFLEAPISRLKTIVPEAKRAIRWKNPEYLDALFQLAATQTVKNLRLILCIPNRAEIPVYRRNGKLDLRVTEEQFNRIKTNTELQFEYVVQEANGKNGKQKPEARLNALLAFAKEAEGVIAKSDGAKTNGQSNGKRKKITFNDILIPVSKVTDPELLKMLGK